jgi:hypothetical protein
VNSLVKSNGHIDECDTGIDGQKKIMNENEASHQRTRVFGNFLNALVFGFNTGSLGGLGVEGMNDDGVSCGQRNWGLPIHEELVVFGERDPRNRSQFVQVLHGDYTVEEKEKNERQRKKIMSFKGSVTKKKKLIQ